MNLQKQFEKETSKESLIPNDYGGYYYSDEYVEWLEKAVENNAVLPLVSGSLPTKILEVERLIEILNKLKEQNLLEIFKNQNQRLITELWSLLR